MHRLPLTGRWTVLQYVAWEGPGPDCKPHGRSDRCSPENQ